MNGVLQPLALTRGMANHEGAVLPKLDAHQPTDCLTAKTAADTAGSPGQP